MRQLLCRLVHLAVSTLPPCHIRVAWTAWGFQQRSNFSRSFPQVDIQKLWVFISSLILGSAFVFGNSLKQLYESVFFLFMVHPFDVGAPWPPGPASLTGHLRQSSGSWR